MTLIRLMVLRDQLSDRGPYYFRLIVVMDMSEPMKEEPAGHLNCGMGPAMAICLLATVPLGVSRDGCWSLRSTRQERCCTKPPNREIADRANRNDFVEDRRSAEMPALFFELRVVSSIAIAFEPRE